MFGVRSKKTGKTHDGSPTRSRLGAKRRWSLRPRSKHDIVSVESNYSLCSIISDGDSVYQQGDDSDRIPPPPAVTLTRHCSEIVKPTLKPIQLDRVHRSAETQKTASTYNLESSLVEFNEECIDVPTVKINAQTHIVEVSGYLDDNDQPEPIEMDTSHKLSSIENSLFISDAVHDTILEKLSQEDDVLQGTENAPKSSIEESFELVSGLLASELSHNNVNSEKVVTCDKENDDDKIPQDRIVGTEKLESDDSPRTESLATTSNPGEERIYQGSENVDPRIGGGSLALPSKLSTGLVGSTPIDSVKKSRVDATSAISDRPPLPPRPEGYLSKDEAKIMNESSRSSGFPGTFEHIKNMHPPNWDDLVVELTQKDRSLRQVSDRRLPDKTDSGNVDSNDKSSKKPSITKLKNQEDDQFAVINQSLTPSDQLQNPIVSRDSMMDDSTRSGPSTTSQKKKLRHIRHASFSSMTKTAFATLGRRSFDISSKGSDKEGSVVLVVEKRNKKTILNFDRKSGQADHGQHDNKGNKTENERKDQDSNLQAETLPSSKQEEVKSPNGKQEEFQSSANPIVDEPPKVQPDSKSNFIAAITPERKERRKLTKNTKRVFDESKQRQPAIETKAGTRGVDRKSDGGTSTKATDNKQTKEDSANLKESQVAPSAKKSVEHLSGEQATGEIDVTKEVMVKDTEKNQAAAKMSKSATTEAIEETDIPIRQNPKVDDAVSKNIVGEDRNNWRNRRSSFGGVVERMYAEKAGNSMIQESPEGSDASAERADRVTRLLKQLEPEKKPKYIDKINYLYRSLSEGSLEEKDPRRHKGHRKYGQYDDIERISKTPSISYEHSCGYYFVPTCLREIFISDGEKYSEGASCWTDTTTTNEFLPCSDSEDIGTSCSTRDESTADRGGSDDGGRRTNKEGSKIENTESLTIDGVNESESADDSIAESIKESGLMHAIEDSLFGVVSCKF